MSFFQSDAEGFITLYCMGEQMSMPRFHAGIAADLFFLSPAATVHLSVVGEIHESSVLSDLDLLTEIFRLRRL